LSSTTERLRRLLRLGSRATTPPVTPARRAGRRDRGQVLVIFAFGAVGILAVAALVFDVGQNLFERRKQQDAADAAALAGARFLVAPGCRTNESVANCPAAYDAALDLATTHGYAAGQITVSIPPASGPFAGYAGHVQVAINANRGSYFAGVVGIAGFQIGASAVAANIVDYPLPFSFLSLNATACKAGQIHGNGGLTVEGDIMMSSTCTKPGALSFDGNPITVSVTGECATSGTINYGPSSTVSCGSTQEGAPAIADPLADLRAPTIGSTAVPKPPASMVVTGAHTASNLAPSGCPGATPVATAASPTGCTIGFNREKVVWIYPGVYYGGLKIRETSDPLTVYMAPGIYYMAGGGFEVSGPVTLKSVEAATSAIPYPTTFGGGVLIYNTDNATCATARTACIRAVDFQNTTGGEVALTGYLGQTYTHMLIWQDRNASAQPAMSVEGNASLSLSGTIYLPKADFKYTGNGAGEVLDAQVICDEFDVGGNGTLTITYDPDDAVKIGGVGLVE
jgi:Flp pilus assembly protein TadG